MSNESLDFLDEDAPAAPSVIEPEANVSTDAPAPETVELTPEERIKAAQVVVDAANVNVRNAQALLQAAIKDAQKAEVEIPLHVRNAEAKAIDQANIDRHNEALSKVAAAGVDVNRLISDIGRPRPRKNSPILFKP